MRAAAALVAALLAALALSGAGMRGAAQVPLGGVAIPLPPRDDGPQAQMARGALAEVARFIFGRGAHLGTGEGEATQEQLENALADIEVAREIAEVYDLADVRLALAAYDAAARFAPLNRRRQFEFEPLVLNSGRIFPALNAATDAIDRAYPDQPQATRRAVLADPARALDPGLPLPVLVAAAMAKAVSHGPFVALEIMERCGRPGERSMPRALMTAVGLAAPDLYDFFQRNYSEPVGPLPREAFIRNVRNTAARCAR